MNLLKKLNIWQKENLISAYQVQAILNYEQQKNRPYFLFYTLLLGCFSLGLGLMALLMAHWEHISLSLKFSTTIIFLLASLFALYHGWKHQNKVIKEASVLMVSTLSFGLLCLINQALTSPLDYCSCLLIWGIVISPLLFMTEIQFFPLLWFPLVLPSIYCVMLKHFDGFSELNKSLYATYPPFLVFVGFAILLSLYLSIRPYSKNLVKALGNWIFVAIIITVLGYEIFLIFAHEPYWKNDNFPFLAFLSFIFLQGFYVLARQKKDGELVGQFLLTLWAYSLIFAFVSSGNTMTDILGFMLTATLLGEALYSSWQLNSQRWFKILTILLALRIFIIFLQVFKSLLTTGIGFCLLGGLFLGIVYFTKRFLKIRLSPENKD